MKPRRYEEMSKSDLLREIYSAQAILGVQGTLQQIAQDLQVHQEEVRVQQSQLVEAQQALEESRDRYADLFDFAPVGYLTLDQAGIVAEINLTAAAMFGTERGRLIGRPMLPCVAPEDQRRFLEHLGRCRESPRTVETRLRLVS